MLDRALYAAIWSELSAEKSMVLLAGPRQCGKTTLARSLSESCANKLYFNWDIATDKRRLIENPHFFEDVVRRDSSQPLVILDEIHKHKHWKNYLKGVYDRFHTEFQFLVSGSGRLDLFRKGGDSLAGRYYLMRLWPLTLAELHNAGVSFEVFSGIRSSPIPIKRQPFNPCGSDWHTPADFPSSISPARNQAIAVGPPPTTVSSSARISAT